MEAPQSPAAAEPLAVRRTALVPTAERMREVGQRIAGLLGPGDLVLLTGELGAGKTTLARGIGAGLGVRGAVTSPTFVIARVHPPLGDGPPLVHVDAYRLGGQGLEGMDDLDLDVSLPESVVIVEWGEGRVEELSEDRLHVVIERETGAAANGGADDGGDGGAEDAQDDERTVTVTGVGERWRGVDLSLLG
ncbi:tRNA threonylcarbamoyladenosine biosynthesis protein TsaE [Streptomyces abyssalis]|uniref:tRNA threonylcarbamoyladenosine biosynthesis protein TsaE n=1 Tax=Streptomyces abyssalis TaxID=933944 RepID=A0A1E7JFN9_9ACTN|nr:tRNA (adenosine(37)-N6)-threonylcarbamoyltransferase complex ATPase subunit type 1 TsaE [Streptomyces abyssalis]OEU85275.1 tRNA threonylcarbamoyladenosine biosynthesis protein TsaE [Streptomyces abyssalis]OEU95943.1 tRNA threonylcarbamoyladenosine biosynthesis protein TsaE [Streptomyces abyssalis]OEV07311.1 tRNA threonylcarbamoyladenosine biosynthesis protein TsaE [Streptomyces nanshensis]